MRKRTVWGINPPFGRLSPARGQVAHVLRTRSPLSTDPKVRLSFDLHVLTTPPAFTLSQDQTLRKKQLINQLFRSDELGILVIPDYRCRTSVKNECPDFF